MCMRVTSLVKSHLMPASLYAYCRKGDLGPVKVGDGIVLPTDRQTKAHLLCSDCEHILSVGGESWIADKLATWERRFPLYDLLTKYSPDVDEDGVAIYFTNKNSEVKADKMAHFALGMFWKAAVHSWRGGETEPRIELGPYAEQIRTWLIGEPGVPEHVYLIAAVSRPELAQITLHDPYEGECEGWHSFFLHVSGILFMLAIGKTVDSSLQWLSIPTRTAPTQPKRALIRGKFMLLVRVFIFEHRQLQRAGSRGTSN